MQKYNKKGFSLIELVVIIAILAIIAAFVVPSLIRYTEESRAQKDVSTMDELVNAFQLALSNSKCYDEAIKYCIDNNFVTYTDSSGKYGTQLADEEFYAPDGCGKAATVTFNPSIQENGSTIYRLDTAIVNDMTYGNGSVTENREILGASVDEVQCFFSELSYLYNAVRSTVGDIITPTSATYKNSSFTVFIRFSQKDSVKVAEVHGAFNGTNLHDGCESAKGSGTIEYDPDTNAPIETEKAPGKVSASYTGSSLGGGGNVTNTGGEIPGYKQPTYVDGLQKENKCEYYSSLQLAAKDINNGTPGENGDTTKNKAVACVYVDESGLACLIVLKDCNEKTNTEFTKPTKVILGGKHITYSETATSGLYFKDYMYVDARLDGSKITNTSPQTSSLELATACITGTGGGEIIGGEYRVCGSPRSATITLQKAKTYLVKKCKVFAESVPEDVDSCNKGAMGIAVAQSRNYTDAVCYIEDCEVYTVGYNKVSSPRGINAQGRVQIQGSTIHAYGDLWQDVDTLQAPAALVMQYQDTIVNDCKIYSNGVAVAATYGGNGVIYNTEINAYYTAGLVSYVNSDATLRLIDCEINKIAKMEEFADELLKDRYALQNDSFMVLHNVKINGFNNAMLVFDDSKTYISNTMIPEGATIFANEMSNIYLGAYNNFTKEVANRPYRIEETNEVYKNFIPSR